MRKLAMFQHFQFAEFQKGKKFLIKGIRYNEKHQCVALSVIIAEDTYVYSNEDKTISNEWETFTVYCVKDTKESDVSKYSIRDEISFVSVGTCKVYGTYNENLLVEAEVKVVK